MKTIHIKHGESCGIRIKTQGLTISGPATVIIKNENTPDWSSEVLESINKLNKALTEFSKSIVTVNNKIEINDQINIPKDIDKHSKAMLLAMREYLTNGF